MTFLSYKMQRGQSILKDRNNMQYVLQYFQGIFILLDITKSNNHATFLQNDYKHFWRWKATQIHSNIIPCFPYLRWPVWRWAGPPCRAVPPVKPGVGAWCLAGTRNWVLPHSAADNWPPPSGSAWPLCAGECSHSVARNKDTQTRTRVAIAFLITFHV